MLGPNLQKIWDELPDEERLAIEARYQELQDEYLTLQELRKALDLTQTDLAGALEINQVNISRLEKRSDLKLSTLRDYLKGLGGTLKLVVDFPGKPSVVIQGLGGLEKKSE
jgi:transcriptional regulator with XRE-family HTH domain